MPLRAWGALIVGVVSLSLASAQPKLLIFVERAPLTQHNDQPYDPNVDLKPHLTPFLQELRKVQVEWYDPAHPIAREFAQRRDLREEQLRDPNPILRAQLARAWGATYVMTVRCTRAPATAQYDYAFTVWELGKRAPVWQARGFQQVATGSASRNEIAALQTLGRTIALRLDSELWKDLPRLAAQVVTPPTRPTPHEPEPLPTDPKQQAEQLLRDGKYHEAVLPLRTLVNAEPENPTWRVHLVRVYRRLGLLSQARQALESATQLLPDDETLTLEWVGLLEAEGNLAEAIARLQTAMQRRDTEPLRLRLFDLQLQAGDAQQAARTLEPLLSQTGEAVQFRRYLLRGAFRQLEDLPMETHALAEAYAALWLQVAQGLMTDLSSELLDIRRLANSPRPDWNALRERSERAVLLALNIGQWLERAQPTEATRTLLAHARFASQLLVQAAQHMARYVLLRKTEELERASLLRIEAMRELEAAKNALPKRTL
ncbi:MAG: tetratricopeptide repeat protein [Fimbriimonadales bacterium]|nr:tetratricopeptide repeat protein [Fimbriimonadales bacterium]MDW8052430.1 tetratricopeptide repeat protein [Armatimonadota bacterium]